MITKKKFKKFNYAVGHYWDEEDGPIGFYSYFGEIHHDTLKEAEKFLKYVKSQSPEEDWRIFQVIELK